MREQFPDIIDTANWTVVGVYVIVAAQPWFHTWRNSRSRYNLDISASISRELERRTMQAAMDITAKHCHREMEAYGSCVASNPSTWQEQCHELKMKVAHCTSSHPVIQKIRQDCSKQFVEFERCLSENQGQPTSCSPHVARFLGCAETVDLSGLGTNPVPQPS